MARFYAQKMPVVSFDNKKQLLGFFNAILIPCAFLSDCGSYGNLVDEKGNILFERTDKNGVFEYRATRLGLSVCKYDI